MTLFVDASALVAIIRREPDAPLLIDRLRDDEARIMSGMALWEVVRAIAKGGDDGMDVAAALREVERFRTELGIMLVPIADAEAAEAIRAHARYGKGAGHPARLNMGDCFAYACAKTNGAGLLYKGDDFTHTDLA